MQVANLSAQKREEGFDSNFNLTEYTPRYYVSTEKKEQGWYREAYYLPERGMAMKGWYKDRECKIPNGETTWFHLNRTLDSKGNYVDGKKEGIWLKYHENGMMHDSANYTAGRLKGVRMQWSEDGSLVDSSFFDGAGNGIEYSWFSGGNLSAAGFWISDTLKNKRWKYFTADGKLLATEDYVNGKRIAITCFNAAGVALDSAHCEEREAYFPGEEAAWRSFIEHTLNPDVPVTKGAPVGVYKVMIQFVVDTKGSIKDIKPLTKFGFGMEQEVMRMLRKSPAWIPAIQFGRNVNAYRKQPVTFAVTQK